MRGSGKRLEREEIDAMNQWFPWNLTGLSLLSPQNCFLHETSRKFRCYAARDRTCMCSEPKGDCLKRKRRTSRSNCFAKRG